METEHINLKDIMEKLNQIQIDINIIKRNSIDHDIILFEDDEVAIEEYIEEKENDCLISHENLKKELDLNN